jgi:hypothetical protein
VRPVPKGQLGKQIFIAWSGCRIVSPKELGWRHYFATNGDFLDDKIDKKLM